MSRRIPTLAELEAEREDSERREAYQRGLAKGQEQTPWSRTKPTEPGLYLFYGELKGYSPPKFALVDVRDTPNGPEYIAEGQCLYPNELDGGSFRPFDEKPPS